MADKDLSFLEEHAGEGLTDIAQEDIQQGLLLISQKLSAVNDGRVSEGHFYNSATGEDYGTSVKVIVLSVQKLWFVWAADQSGLVGRYEPYSIEVTGDNYTGMRDKDGNRVIETYCYGVLLPEHPEDGALVLTSTRGSMKYFRQWNRQIKAARLPSGKPAPIYANVWTLTTALDQNKGGKSYYSLKGGIVKEGYITSQLSSLAISARSSLDVQTSQLAITDESGAQDTDF